MIGEHYERKPRSRWLKSTEWLADNLGKVVVVDASYYLPNQNRDAKAEYLAAHIPGAVFFDINAISDTSTDLPHMLPGPDQFGKAVGKLGIAETDTIVVYDATGLYSAPRVWWSFRIFGAKNAFVLDGGLPAWKAAGGAIEAGEVKRPARTFKATMDTGAVAMVSDVQVALNDGSAQVVDARAAGRFVGRDPDPRPGLRPGHMPGALNVPFADILNDGRLARARGSPPLSPKPASIPTSRPSPVAAPASPRWCSRSGSMLSASRCRVSTTAPGRNGADDRICQSRRIRASISKPAVTP